MPRSWVIKHDVLAATRKGHRYSWCTRKWMVGLQGIENTKLSGIDGGTNKAEGCWLVWVAPERWRCKPPPLTEGGKGEGSRGAWTLLRKCALDPDVWACRFLIGINFFSFDTNVKQGAHQILLETSLFTFYGMMLRNFRYKSFIRCWSRPLCAQCLVVNLYVYHLSPIVGNK